MKRVTAFILTLWIGGLTCVAQNTQNVGFEDGTANAWVLTNGNIAIGTDLKVQYLNEAVGTFEDGHFITRQGDGYDPKVTAERIPVVAPGSKYSMRLGNIAHGNRFDRIKTSFVVTPDNTLFQYQFAVVLQRDNNHRDYQKPGFTIEIFDKDGAILGCNSYDVQLSSSSTASGFKVQGDIEYRNWTTGAMDLKNFVGRTITVVVTAHGCTERRHYGYAYFDAKIIKSEIKQASKCPDVNGFLTLIAPEGFEKYKWNTGEASQTIKIKPNAGDKYFVKLTPASSLHDNCEFQLDYQIKTLKADTTLVKSICEGENVIIENTTFDKTGNYTIKVNRGSACDSTVNLRLTVRSKVVFTQNKVLCEGESLKVGDKTYTQSGTYTTTIVRPNLCDSIVTTNLTIENFRVEILPQGATLTDKDSLQLRAVVTPNGNYTYQWTPADLVTCVDCPTTWAKPTHSAKYSVQVNSTKNTACKQLGRTTIFVNKCSIYSPEAFSPNSDQLNDVFYIQAGDCIKSIKAMTIFNRWGEVVFYKENFPPSSPQHGWAGMYLGQILTPDAYAFKVTVTFADTQLPDYTFTGSVMLVK